jgi:hypothetical protein
MHVFRSYLSVLKTLELFSTDTVESVKKCNEVSRGINLLHNTAHYNAMRCHEV